MDLKELKKEVAELEDLTPTIDSFRCIWVKPMKNNLLNFSSLSTPFRNDVFSRIAIINSLLDEIQVVQKNSDRFRYMARGLIDLKLSLLNKDKSKAKMLTNHFLKDDFFKVENIINDTKKLQLKINELQLQHKELQQLLWSHLQLEDKLVLVDENASFCLNNLKNNANKHKQITQKLSNNFIRLVKDYKALK